MKNYFLKIRSAMQNNKISLFCIQFLQCDNLNRRTEVNLYKEI